MAFYAPRRPPQIAESILAE